MNTPAYNYDGENHESNSSESRDDRQFKKLKRPILAAKRSKVPERLHGIHRRRRKRMGW